MTAKKKKPHQKDKNIALNRFKRQLKEANIFKEQQIVLHQPGDGVKLSAVLLEFIEPYKKLAKTTKAYNSLLTLAIISWNAVIMGDEKRKELIDSILNTISNLSGEEVRKDAQEIIAMMMRRKEQYFADDKRIIVNYHLAETENNYHLSVISVV